VVAGVVEEVEGLYLSQEILVMLGLELVGQDYQLEEIFPRYHQREEKLVNTSQVEVHK
jgi:hypothetical protein